METLKSLRAKAKELRSKVSSAPLSKATPDQLRSEILMLERAVKADEKVQMKKALKDATVVPLQKKKTTELKVKVVAKTSPMEEREKELLKREKMIAKKEKLFQTQQPKPKVELESDSDGY